MGAVDDYKAALLETNRIGIEVLLKWLSGTDFFVAPSSTAYHGAYPGGLLDHSLNVMDNLFSLADLHKESLPSPISDDSIVIVSLLHDLCKADYYVMDVEKATTPQMNLLDSLGHALPKDQQTKAYVGKVINALKSNEEIPPFTHAYKVKEAFPMGHGEKSLYLASQYIKLSKEEALAIRWHLGAFDPGFNFGFPSGYPAKQAIKENGLVSLLIAADFLSTWITENEDLK